MSVCAMSIYFGSPLSEINVAKQQKAILQWLKFSIIVKHKWFSGRAMPSSVVDDTFAFRGCTSSLHPMNCTILTTQRQV
jgi:hypothetical protein